MMSQQRDLEDAMTVTQTVVIMAKKQHLEILKLIHAGIGQCWHWETMNFHKEIQRIKKIIAVRIYYSGKL